MRVISQDGTIDIPYDYFSLSIVSGKCKDVEVACIYCHNLSSPNGTMMAEYSSKEKAIKTMEMLREAWINEAIEFTHGIYHRNIVFQFPQDDEIEV
ncbi:MAG: hypothetical protein ACLTHR_15180 [Agathobacter rectalis]|uniref:Photosynthetic reaction centre cytochrome C subunit n=1 Tax=virus sp. ctReX5 TaxID=2825818 RepID=A0A8S5RLU5_9VIRU|nr:MAG TPA: Photosynthetic reaction centre cytochrome C subunit [virus sp. ctReX5]